MPFCTLKQQKYPHEMGTFDEPLECPRLRPTIPADRRQRVEPELQRLVGQIFSVCLVLCVGKAAREYLVVHHNFPAPLAE